MDDAELASVGGDYFLRFWSIETGQQILELEDYSDGVEYSPDGQRIAVAHGRDVHLLNAETKELDKTLNGKNQRLNGLTWSPDGNRIAAIAISQLSDLIVWDANYGFQKGTYFLRYLSAGPGVGLIAFSKYGDKLFSQCNDYDIHLSLCMFASDTVTFLGKYPVKNTFIPRGVALNLDGTKLAVIADKTVKIYDFVNGQEIAVLGGHMGSFGQMVVSPDGLILASGNSDSSIRLWDSATGKLQTIYKGRSSFIRALAFSADGSTLLSGGGGDFDGLSLWDVKSGELVKEFPEHLHDISAGAISPDGTMIASASFDSTVDVWDITTGNKIHFLALSPEVILGLAFSPDSKYLAMAGRDGNNKVHILDIETGGGVTLFL